MRRTALALSAVLAGLLATPGTASAPADAHVTRPAVSPVVQRALGPAGELRGMALDDVGYGRLTLEAAVLDFPRMASEGITSVTAYVYLYLLKDKGNDVFPGPLTPTDAELRLVAREAAKSGLQTILMPVLINPSGNFRGGFEPTDTAAFFRSYSRQIVRYADLAQELGSPLYYVGSENNVIAAHTEQWTRLIREVRRHYRGALTYMATAYAAPDVAFWGALDLVAISPYFSLGLDPVPTYERMLQAWKQAHLPYLAGLAKALKKPIVFGELGYHSQHGTYEGPASGKDATHLPTPEAQADAYRAVLDALRTAPGVYGVTWFRWGTGTTPVDTSFAPNGKPAECVIAAHWAPDPVVRAQAGNPFCEAAWLDDLAARVNLSGR